MKRFMTILAMTLCLSALTACDKEEPLSVDPSSHTEGTISVGSFSYTEDASYWAEMEEGVQKEGFQNVIEQKIETAEDALALAKKEVTVSYNKTAVAFDETENMWRVDFWTEEQAGGDQSVYMDENGLTKLCVWGE